MVKGCPAIISIIEYDLLKTKCHSGDAPFHKDFSLKKAL